MLRTPPLQRRSAVLLLAVSLICFVPGCGDSVPHIDTSNVYDPLQKPGTCEICKKPIDEVADENCLIVRGNRYIVCDEKCAEDMKEWLAKQ